MHELSGEIEDDELRDDAQQTPTIVDVLEKVVGLKVVNNTNDLPHFMCPMCLSFLKIAHKFIRQFESSQLALKELLNEPALVAADENGDEKNVVPVEVIVGDAKYDLNDIVVVQDDLQADCDYQGFLSNLGTEVSASFVKNNVTDEAISITPIDGDDLNDDSQYIEIITLQNDSACGTDSATEKTPVVMNTRGRRNLRRKKPAVKRKKKKETNDEGDSDEFFNKNLLFPCDICKNVFATSSKLKRHKTSIHGKGESGYTCEICGYATKTRSGAKHHRLTHFDKKYFCNLCNKAFYTSSTLKVHREIHNNSRQHLCNVCGKSFNYPNALVYHLRTHTGEKRYVCNYCGAKFTMSCGLKRHLRTHTGDRPYKCQFCEKSFSSKGEVQTHETIHTGYKPYHCNYCGKGFTKTHNLKLHLLSHDGPHKCDICGKSFIEMSILLFHYKIVHKEYS